MTSLVYRRKTCRLCDSTDLVLVLILTPCPPVDAYVLPSKRDEFQEVFPLDLFLCVACGHAQLLDVVSPKLLFGSYIYKTSSSPGLIDHFASYANEVLQYARPDPGAFAVDIGSNDGTFLRFLKSQGLQVLGIDPAREIAREATRSGVETLPEFFSTTLANRVLLQRGRAKIVTANNVFAHADDLADMAEAVRDLLAPDGVFVFEVSYLLDMLQHMVFDFIYHEHLSHHSVKPLQAFLARHGLELAHIERNMSKGGTLRCYAHLASAHYPVSGSVAELLALEDNFKLYDLQTYKKYAMDIGHAKKELSDAISTVRKSGQKLVGYGASATATVLLYHFELGDILDCIIDDNPDRQGLYSPGHHIPVVSSEVLAQGPPPAVIILAWRFAEMIVARHSAFLARGGRFIVPLPKLKII